MKILRVIDTLDPRTGGPAVALRALTPALRDLGHETVVVTLDRPDAPHATLAGAEVVPLGPAYGRYRLAPALRPWLDDNIGRFDAAIVHGLWQHAGHSLRLAARRRRVPYFVYPHGMLDPWFRRAEPRKHMKKWFYWQFIERHVLRDAAAVLFTCEEERRLARTTFAPYACVERVVNYGTAGAPPAGEAQSAAWFARHPELRRHSYLLFLGRLHPKKGVDLLLQAWLDHGGREPGGPALVIAGPEDDPELMKRLHALAATAPAGRIVWAGMIDGAVKWGALREAEALVLPSHQENFGVVVAEALAVGTPVLLSERVNIWREIVADGAGLAEPDTADGIGRLLAAWRALAPDARTAMRAHAADCYRRRFQLDAVARSFLEVIGPFVAPTRRAA